VSDQSLTKADLTILRLEARVAQLELDNAEMAARIRRARRYCDGRPISRFGLRWCWTGEIKQILEGKV